MLTITQLSEKRGRCARTNSANYHHLWITFHAVKQYIYRHQHIYIYIPIYLHYTVLPTLVFEVLSPFLAHTISISWQTYDIFAHISLLTILNLSLSFASFAPNRWAHHHQRTIKTDPFTILPTFNISYSISYNIFFIRYFVFANFSIFVFYSLTFNVCATDI